MTYCPSPTSISAWASAPVAAPTTRPDPIPSATRARDARCVKANRLRFRSRCRMAVLLVAARCVFLIRVIITGARCGDRRQPVPENDHDDSLISLGSKECEPDVPRYSRFSQTGSEGIPVQRAADVAAGDRIHRLVAFVDHHC